MFNRFRNCITALSLASLAVLITGCSTTSSGLDSIQVTPATNSIAVGTTTQLTVTGTFGNAKHPTSGAVSGITWSSANTNVAVVGPCTSGVANCPKAGLSAGEVLAEGNGTTSITAKAQGYNGPVSSSATITVTGGTGTGPVSSTGLVSLTIVPSSIAVGDLLDTGNFLAIATYDVAPEVRDVTNSVVWTSSFPNAFPVDTNTGGNLGATAGIVTAYANGIASIMAEVTDPVTGSIQYATASFSCPYVAPCPCSVAQGCETEITACPNGPVAGSCFPGSESTPLLSTVTVYNEGLNTTNWLVTAPSATGTPDVIHCGPGWALNGGTGGSVCVATYPINTRFTLTAPAGTGNFGGWSANCAPNPNPPTAAGPNACTLTPTTGSVTVGAIFN